MKKLLPLLSLLIVPNLEAQIFESAAVGDVNGDGTVSVADIVTLVNILNTPQQNLYYWQASNNDKIILNNSNNRPSQRFIYCADVNLDGNVDQDDLLWLVQTIIDEVGDVEIAADNQDLYCEFDDQPEETPDWAEGHGLVDMGIKDEEGHTIYWATCNVGAECPEEYGDYFAWGETSTKSYYHWSTYTLCRGDASLLKKYSNSSIYGCNDGKIELETMDDAAQQNWKGPWRMPTKKEMQALKDNCIWVWSKMETRTHEDVWGYTVISLNTQNHIFLPAGGYRYIDDFTLKDQRYGYYWTKDLGNGAPTGASSLVFCYKYDSQSLENDVTLVNNQRDKGLTIRPVCSAPNR